VAPKIEKTRSDGCQEYFTKMTDKTDFLIRRFVRWKMITQPLWLLLVEKLQERTERMNIQHQLRSLELQVININL